MTERRRWLLARGPSAVIVGVIGGLHLLTGLSLLLTPAWFFAAVGPFPPYNRHYEGDLGAFILAIGLGLLVAARGPQRQVLLIGVAAIGNLVHALNHTYDTVIAGQALSYWLADTGPLLLTALLLGWCWAALRSGH